MKASAREDFVVPMIGSCIAIAEVLARLSEAEARFRRPRTQAKLSKAQAKCAQELQELSRTHANSPAWATNGIAAVVRFCHEPASATDAVCALFNLSAAEANWTAIIEAGAIPPLVALLSGRPEDAAAKAAGALSNLADHEAGKAAIISAGAIPPLVALLGGEPESAAAERAAGALRKLSRDNAAGKAAIIEASAIPPLVVLLGGGPESEAAASAAGALCNLASDEAAKAAIVEAGAIPPLVALLRGGPKSKAAERAARVLDRLVSGTHTTVAVLEEVARATADCSFRNSLHAKLSKCASERLREIYADTERQKRREALGLGSYELPHEFMCPITFEVMRDPVVASDGHSYERSAILLVVNGVNRRSPLTREPLRPNVLIPNLNLKKRILAFEEDLLRAAAIAVANATDGAQQQGSVGTVASRAAPPTGRRREHEALHKKAQSLQQQVQHAESRLKQQQRDASAAQGRLLAELDEVSRWRRKTEANFSQQLAAARGVATELHGRLERKKESHARELRSLREELKELSGAKRALEANAGIARGAAAAEGAAEGAGRKKPRLEQREPRGVVAPNSSAAGSAGPLRELVLVPLTPGGVEDGRTEVRLPLHVTTQISLGRHSRVHPNPWGIKDPRVSRFHVHLRAAPPGSACVKVMGANPVQVIHDGGASTTTLKKSQECTLSEGDQINLVVEAAVAATGRSFWWSGNPCAYRVNFVQTSAATANARAPTRRSPRAPSRGRAY